MKVAILSLGLLLSGLNQVVQATDLSLIQLKKITKIEKKLPERSMGNSIQFIRDQLSGEGLVAGVNALAGERVRFDLSCEAYIHPTGHVLNYSQIKITSLAKSKVLVYQLPEFSDCARSLDKIQLNKEIILKGVLQ